MERHIQADNAFMEWMEAMSKNVVHIADAWYAAVKWADSYPHWISVEDYVTDELPPLMNEKDHYGESMQVLFVVVLNGVQYISKGTFDYDTGVWHSLDMQCSFCKENVTHWMPLPELPKKGGKK